MKSYHAVDFDVLIATCCAERDRFHAGERDAATCSLAVVRHAIATDSPLHWEVFYVCFFADVVGYVRRHPLAATLLECDAAEAYAQEAFTRFVQRNRRAPLDLPHFGAVMIYLKRCVNSAMLEAWRRWQQQSVLNELKDDYDAPVGDTTEGVLDQLAASELWNLITRLAPSPRALRVAYLVWVENYRPRELPRLFAAEFPKVKEVYYLLAVLTKHVRRALQAEADARLLSV